MRWIRSTIGEHCTVTSSKRFHLSERTDKGVPFYCSKEIIQRYKGEEVTACDYISEELYTEVAEKFGVPQANDLLVTTRGTIGVPYVYRSTDRFYFADGNLTWLKDFKDTLLPQYLYYWFLTHEGQKKIDAIAKGTAQKAVPIAGIKTLEILLPPIDVQYRIVDALSAYDDLIDNNQKQIKLLEEAAQRLYKEWFVDLRFPGHETTPIVDGVPVGWREQFLYQFADVIMGQSPKSEYYNQVGEGLPFHQGVGSYGERFVIDKTYSSSFARIAKAGSVLFSVRAPVGRLNLTKNKVVIGRGLAAINHRWGAQSYLFYLLKERFFRDDIIGNGSIFASISKEELLNQRFLIPIDSLVAQFNGIAAELDEKIDILSEQIRLLAEARDRLLSKLMNGEIEV